VARALSSSALPDPTLAALIEPELGAAVAPEVSLFAERLAARAGVETAEVMFSGS
jgi:hypothetical protein